MLVDIYPDHTVYIDLCPKDFNRPSFLIEVIRTDQDSVNCKTVREIVFYTITCFDVTDDYSNSDTTRLLAVQQDVLDLFRSGYIFVDSRAVKIKASSGGRDFDQAYIDVQVEYFEDRSDAVDTMPLIKEVITTMEEE